MSLEKRQLAIYDAIFCDVSDKWDEKLLVESQRESKLHQQAKLVTTSSSQGKQTDTTRSSELQGKSSLFISSSRYHTPLTESSCLKSQYVALGKPLPSETAARASVVQLASQNEENI